MRTLAHITSAVLIIAGLLVMVSALVLGASGLVHPLMGFAATARPIRGAGLASVLLVAYIFTHGLVLAGAGEGLYFLASLPAK